jgi:hypothetical protein
MVGAACASDPLYRMTRWQQLTAEYWGQRKMLFRLSKTAMLWLPLALALAYLPETRAYAIYPMLAAVILASLREFIPLAPVPMGTHNSVTSTWGKYTTAALAAMASLLLLAACGSLLAFTERLGNAYLQKKHLTFWDRPLAWTSAAMVLVPVVYFSSLSVADRFVDQCSLGKDQGQRSAGEYPEHG